MAYSFNVGTLSRQEMDEILREHAVELDGYLFNRVTREPLQPIKKRKGTFTKRPATFGRGQDALADDTVVAPGAPTPKGDQWLEDAYFACRYRKKAYGIDDLIGEELMQALDIWAAWSLDAAHDVSISHERELINVLRGLGTAGNAQKSDQKVRTKTLTAGAGVGGPGILTTLTEIKRSSVITRAIIGEDVALAMCQNPVIIGAAGGSKNDNTMIGFDALTNFLRQFFGITDTIIGAQSYQDGARQFAYKHGNLHDNVFYFDDGKNLMRPAFKDLVYDEFSDKDTEMSYVRAKMDATIVAEYEEYSVAVTNPNVANT